jgi:anti-sigma factor RsiW
MSEEELISAYLDGQLSAAEQAAFEARLAGDPELRRRVLVTRLIIREARQLPMVAPPRNFILPADAGRRPVAARTFLPLWVYRFGALAAVLLCIVLVVADFGPSAMPSESIAPAAQPALPSAPAQGERVAPLDAEPRAFALPESAPPESANAAGSWIAPPRVLALLLLALAIVLGVLGWGKRRR